MYHKFWQKCQLVSPCFIWPNIMCTAGPDCSCPLAMGSLAPVWGCAVCAATRSLLAGLVCLGLCGVGGSRHPVPARDSVAGAGCRLPPTQDEPSPNPCLPSSEHSPTARLCAPLGLGAQTPIPSSLTVWGGGKTLVGHLEGGGALA